MKSYMLVALFLFIYISNVIAQMPDFSKEVKAAMLQVSVMEGKWEGKGWRVNPNGEKAYSNVEENLQWKLDSTIILIEGIGKTDDGNVVHNALAVLSFDPFKKKYAMKSFLSNGMSTDAYFEIVEENKIFKWGFDVPRGGKIQYTITNDGTNWKEEGEYSADGENWNKIFEMILVKVE